MDLFNLGLYVMCSLVVKYVDLMHPLALLVEGIGSFLGNSGCILFGLDLLS